MMIQWLIDHFLPVYFYLAVVIGVGGTAFMLLRYYRLRRTAPREMTQRARTPYPVRRTGLIKALWATNIRPYQIWFRANPMMFIGHTFYHAGLFLGMATYAVVALVGVKALIRVKPDLAMRMTCDWFQYKHSLFNGTVMTPKAAGVLEDVFVFALLIAVIGIATPFLMSLFHRRGMTRSMDTAQARAGINRTSGLANTGSLKIQRKAMGVMVLAMDALMLSTFYAPVSPELACLVHVTFALTLLAAMPFSFLFHEIYRLRMWSGVLRVIDGRTA